MKKIDIHGKASFSTCLLAGAKNGYIDYLRKNKWICYKRGAVQDKTNLYCTFCGAKIGDTCECYRSAVCRKDAFCRNCGSKLNRKQAAE